MHMPDDPIQARKTYSLHQFRILVADDFGFMADLMSSMLREFGVGSMMIAESGNDAMDLLRIANADAGSRNHVDIALVDWLMPNGNGIDLLHWIRTHKKPSIKFLPVIFISAYTSEDVVIAARDNGANEAMVKPISAEALAKRILHVIDHPRPFVKAPGFFGPDRRRKEKRFEGEDKRVTDAETIKVNHERH